MPGRSEKTHTHCQQRPPNNWFFILNAQINPLSKVTDVEEEKTENEYTNKLMENAIYTNNGAKLLAI